MNLNRAAFRKKAGYGIAFLSEVLAPLMRLQAFTQSYGRATDPQTWRRGLLYGAHHIGDVLYRTSALERLHRYLPLCEWTFVVDAPASEILEGNPAIAKTVHPRDFLQLRKLGRPPYDVIVCYNSSGYWSDLHLAVKLGIPNRVGYTHKGFSGWVTHPVSIQYPRAFPRHFGSLVQQLTQTTDAIDPRPVIYLTKEDHQLADSFVQKSGLNRNLPLLAVFMGTRQPTGLWPREHFVTLFQLLQSIIPFQLVLCGSATERETLSAIAQKLSIPSTIIAGELTLKPMAAFLQKCQAVLTPDSGPRHLANAVGARVFFFRNLRSSQIETGAYVPTETDLIGDGEFLMPEAQQSVLQKISPEFVAKQLLSALGRKT